MNDEEKFKTALDLRNLEVSLFWERSNFFLALNTAVAVGYFALTEKVLALPLAALGFLSSLFWLFCNLGSKFWQARWEEKLRQVELQVYPSLQFFGENYKEIEKQVTENLRRQSRSFVSRWLSKAVLTKPSVSSMVIYLSAVFVVLWAIFLGLGIYTFSHG